MNTLRVENQESVLKRLFNNFSFSSRSSVKAEKAPKTKVKYEGHSISDAAQELGCNMIHFNMMS